jgi:methyl-accepting chemotaxis protein
MGEISAAVAAAVQEQTAATDEIARNVEQASAGTQEVSSNISSVEQAAKETGNAAEQIKESATDLSKQAEFLRQEVGRFLVQVRADKKDMKLMDWSSELDTGVERIDRYHHGIFEHMNEFYREMMSGDAGKTALKVLSKLENEMHEHFKDEEGLMSSCRYPDAGSHRRAHEEFLKRIPELRKAFESNHPEASAQMFEYLANWLKNHITSEDKALASFMQSHKLAA